MPPVRIVSAQEGPRLTVNQMVRDPLLIPERIIRVTSQRFVADKLLRYAGDAPGGAVQFWESTPLFAEDQAEIVNEYAEIPVAHTQVGEPKTERTRRRAIALVVSEDMRRRNRVDRVTRQIVQIRNTIVRSVDGSLMAALRAAVSQEVVAAQPWSSSTSAIRRNINAARGLITALEQEYEPDTLVIHPSRATDLLNSDEFTKPYAGDIAGQNPLITGELPGTVLGLKPLLSYQALTTEAWVGQAKTVGGIADERALRATELYYRPENESHRSDVSRISAGFIDEPGAFARITGI